MGIAGVPAGAPPGTKSGMRAGNPAGLKTDYIGPTQSVDSVTGAVNIAVGTMSAQQCLVPRNGIQLTVPTVTAPSGGTVDVNVKLDGENLLSANQTFNPPGGTVTVSPDQNKMVADIPEHTLELAVVNFTGASGTIAATITPTVTAIGGD